MPGSTTLYPAADADKLTLNGLLTATAGATLTGTTNINTTGSAATNINTGTNTGDVSIGNGTGTFALTSNGGLNVTTGGALTGVVSIDTIAVSATDLTFANGGTLSATNTGLNLQGDGAVDVNLAGGNSATGCTVQNSTGNLTCTGNITGNSTGTVGYWSRTGTSLYPASDGDSLTLNGLLTATAGATLVGTVNINTTGTGNTAIGNGTGTFALTSTGMNVTTAGVITLPGAQTLDLTTAGATTLKIAPGGAAALTLGSAATTAINLTTAGTGDSAVVLPSQSVSAGEITNDTITATQLASTLTFADGDFIDLSNINHSTSASEGIRLPYTTVDPADLTGLGGGYLVYNNNVGSLQFWNGANWVTVSSGTGASKWTETGSILYPNNYGTKDFAIGGTTLASPFSVDISANEVRIGSGSTANGTISLYASNGETGSLIYNTSDYFHLTGGNVQIDASATIGGTINSNTITPTAFTFPNGGTLSATNTGLNLQGDGAVDVNLAGGLANTGCTVYNSTGNLSCTGNITGASSGTVGYWSRDAGSTTLYPAADADKLTLNGLLTATAGATLVGTVNINTTGTGNTAIGNATGTFALTSNGGLNVTTGGALTGVVSIDTIAVSATDLTFANGGTLSATNTGLNLQGDGAVDVNLAGGNSATGCTVQNSTGNLTCTGNITGTPSGTVGYWSRTGTSLYPASDGDSLTLNGLLTATAGATLVGTVNINTTGTGNTSIGNGTGTFALNSSAFDVSTAGVLSGITGYSQTSGDFALNSNGLDVTTGGALTGVVSIDTIAVSATDLTFANGGTLSATNTGLNLQGDGAVDVNLAGGNSATGCTVQNSTGNLTCTGNITGNSTGTVGYWSRTGTSLYPASDGDSLTLNGLLTATAGATLVGTVNINTTGTGNTAIGNGTGTFALNSSAFDVSTAGVLSGITGYSQTSVTSPNLKRWMSPQVEL